jgi:hypothetical protein
MALNPPHPVSYSVSAPFASRNFVNHEERMQKIWERLTDNDGPITPCKGCDHRRCVFQRVRRFIQDDYRLTTTRGLLTGNLDHLLQVMDAYDYYVHCSKEPPATMTAKDAVTWKSLFSCDEDDNPCGGTAKCERPRCIFELSKLTFTPLLKSINTDTPYEEVKATLQMLNAHAKPFGKTFEGLIRVANLADRALLLPILEVAMNHLKLVELPYHRGGEFL